MMAITIDEMLDLLSFAGAELGSGNANHGPMASEALFALGRDEAVLPWVEDYRSRLMDRPTPSLMIPRSEWREFLGARERLGDWIAFFENELKEAAWQDVVRHWAPLLAPAVISAATHGLIRTAHAARNLSSADTPQRRYELAQGLGFWAARYDTLPGEPSTADAGFTPAAALDRVERLHDPSFDGAGPISQQIKGLEGHGEFGPVINLVDAGGDVSQFLSNLTETCAAIYLANPKNLIAFVHTVTAPSALRMLASYLDEADARQAARYAWQACAGIYSWYSTVSLQDAVSWETPAEGWDEIIDRAVAAAGAHSIKFTEACRREYALNPNPVYLAAAWDVSERVGPI